MFSHEKKMLMKINLSRWAVLAHKEELLLISKVYSEEHFTPRTAKVRVCNETEYSKPSLFIYQSANPPLNRIEFPEYPL